ncbi:hypothetical protein PVAP13_5KG777600 [Panicum virgatum]|uniref:Uncharacterized protein n=1 Tax=Panicum virgatum TaxID=38727 RepID=A0A8T0SXR6_PANVG|nr:hypothetical protein PVAP13_5KG777600 [Panicum virgatum]
MGLDGLRGPLLSGTGFYVRRDALYGATPPAAYLQSTTPRPSTSSSAVVPLDATLVASCAFEEGTGWGDHVGFMYQSVVEDYFTGYRRFFARGWTSAYCYPAPATRPPFLGTVPTNLNDVLVQNKRWMSGLLAVGLSRHCPLACRDLLAVSVPQAMAIAYFGFLALYAFPVLCYATLPQLCFRRRLSVLAAPAPGRGVGGQPEAGGAGLVERAEALDAQRRHRPALRLRQRLPGPARRRASPLRPHRQGRRRQPLPQGRLRLHGLLHAAAPGHHALRAQRRGARRRDLEDDGDNHTQRRRAVPAALPPELRCGAELPAAGGDVPPAGSRKGSMANHCALSRLGRRPARTVWMRAQGLAYPCHVLFFFFEKHQACT